jgi:hypothetical protein
LLQKITTDKEIRSLKTHLKAHSNCVRITHPAHPLQGQSFPVVQLHRKEGDTHLIKIQLDNGECRLIPSSWTDQCPPVTTLPGARFVLANLLSLRQCVDSLLRTADKSGILSPQHDTSSTGGSDENAKSTHVVRTDGGSTSTGHCHPGADGLAPTGEGEGG